MTRKSAENYDEQESQKRFEAALRGGFKSPQKTLKTSKPKAKAKKKPAK